jgi:hypothetical protein
MVLVAHKQNFGSTTQANGLAHQEAWLHKKNFCSIVLPLGINFELSNNKCPKNLQQNHSCPIHLHMVCFSLLTRFWVQVEDNYCVSPVKFIMIYRVSSPDKHTIKIWWNSIHYRGSNHSLSVFHKAPPLYDKLYIETRQITIPSELFWWATWC